MNFNQLSVKETILRINDQAKTVIFDIPAELQTEYQWQAGQHITLSFDIDGKAVRRSYTISASPHVQNQDGLQITTKRVKDGLISNYINDNLAVGDTVLVAPPKGNFVLEPTPNKQRTHYFFGAGSGITPLWAMINTVLLKEPHSTCHLLYANQNDTTTIFKDEFEQLQAQFPKRLTVSHIFSKPKESWLGNDFKYWKKGRIDQAVIADFINEHPPYAQDTQYYMCAPNALLSIIQSSLQNIDVPSDRIHFETFGGAIKHNAVAQTFDNGISIDPSAQGLASTLTVSLNGQSHEVSVEKDQTLLDAMLASGIDAPYSCESGVCGTCKCELTDGLVAMKANVALDYDEINKGSILTCQALSQTDKVGISVD